MKKAKDSLKELGKKYKTDKCGKLHNYMDIYSSLFEPIRDEKLSILEIGILNGASLNVWRDFFENSQIYGIDTKSKCMRYEKDNVKIFIGDQANEDFLHEVGKSVPNGFDIIIDDGGHHMYQQQISLKILFNYVKPGGLYVAEDLHTSRTGNYQRKYNKDNSIPTMRMIESIDSGKLESTHFSKEEAETFLKQLDRYTLPLADYLCIFYRGNKT